MVFQNIGSFSIDDGKGSENVSFKMNSRFFNLCRVYSNLLKMANVGEFPHREPRITTAYWRPNYKDLNGNLS